MPTAVTGGGSVGVSKKEKEKTKTNNIVSSLRAHYRIIVEKTSTRNM